MAAHSAATTVAVAGAAASTITGTSTTTSTAISAEATFSALGGSWRWDPRCCEHGYRWRAGGGGSDAHGGLVGSDKRSGDLSTPTVTTATSVAADTTWAHTAAATTAVPKVATTCGKTPAVAAGGGAQPQPMALRLSPW